MVLEAVWITFAFSIGLLVRTFGLPSLVGYLAAGFAISMFAEQLNLPVTSGAVLEHVAHIGVLLLLFTVGLKLNVRNLVTPEVIGSGLVHFGLSVVLLAPALHFFMSISVYTAVMLAIALAFSSTVLAAKVLESRRELGAFHGRIAIGILIVQDLLALLVMSLAGGTTPTFWALAVFALPLARPLLYRLLDLSGHDDLLVLFGLLLALVIGGYGFEVVGLSSELGALLLGALMGGHRQAGELSKSLWGIREFFLVGFFLQIGIDGLPGTEAWVFALIMLAILPLKGMLFFLLLIVFKLRARSAFLSSLSLGNYSEFGLIVASVVLPEWLVPLALTMALSFVISAPLNRVAHPLYERLAERLIPLERDTRHPDEQPLSLGDAEVLIIGMGRTGTAAYEHLKDKTRLVALDSDPARVTKHTALGRNVYYADAEDQGFWQDMELGSVRAVILTLSDMEAKVIAARKLRQAGFEGLIASHTLHEDETAKIMQAGADHMYLTMSEAGAGLAQHVYQDL